MKALKESSLRLRIENELEIPELPPDFIPNIGTTHRARPVPFQTEKVFLLEFVVVPPLVAIEVNAELMKIAYLFSEDEIDEEEYNTRRYQLKIDTQRRIREATGEINE